MAAPTDKVMNMMKSMGYAPGEGLGKHKQGITAPIAARNKIGRRGLGVETEQQHKELEALLENELEHKSVEETPEWLECPEEQRTHVMEQMEKLGDEWITLGTPITKDDDFKAQDRYCPAELLAELLEAKNVFDTMERREMEAARARANPYETIKAGFFQNRAAMKTANLDKIFGWRLSWEFDGQKRSVKNPITSDQERVNSDRRSPLFYFADVCAGPGGFSEYMLWRKAYYNAKGFGFTLEGRDDFKLDRFKAAPPEYFEAYYGIKDDGNVMNPENLLSLEKFVQARIGTGVHLVMCDGGFSVDGQENRQEVLSKRLYLCQFIVGLSLCRAATTKTIKAENVAEKGGNFLCKLFDVFTPFSMGLIYLMYVSFEKISIHKPITSRPANSERYIFCENLNKLGASKIKQYLMEVNNRLDVMERKKEDIMELVPDQIIRDDECFMDYMRNSIEEIARRQVFYLRKYKHFAAIPGTYDQDQSKLRDQALHYWELPDYIERPREVQRGRNKNWHHTNEAQKQPQKPESVTELFRRISGNQLTFPIKRRIAHFTEDVLKLCPDVAELRALPMTDPNEPILLVSQGHDKLLMHRRTGFNFEPLQELNTTIPNCTLLMAQSTILYELKDSGKIEPAGKCLWVLDAAVLDGDDVSQLELKARIAAARKFAAAVNRLQIREAVFERDPNQQKQKRMEYSGHRYRTFGELIVAEPLRLKALTELKFAVKQFKGSRTAFFPVWARNDRRDQPPQKHFVACRAVRILNVLNPNFMLQRNARNEEAVVARPGATLEHNPCSHFYASFMGFLPTEQLITSYPDGHPHGGAISFNWSWEPDYTANFTVEDILNPELERHPAGLTMRAVRRLVDERQRLSVYSQHNQQQQQKKEEEAPSVKRSFVEVDEGTAGEEEAPPRKWSRKMDPEKVKAEEEQQQEGKKRPLMQADGGDEEGAPSKRSRMDSENVKEEQQQEEEGQKDASEDDDHNNNWEG